MDPLRQAIADSWPNSLDDSAAREEWGWKSEYDLESMTQDMIENIKKLDCKILLISQNSRNFIFLFFVSSCFSGRTLK
jgi:hypothetical protein